MREGEAGSEEKEREGGGGEVRSGRSQERSPWLNLCFLDPWFVAWLVGWSGLTTNLSLPYLWGDERICADNYRLLSNTESAGQTCYVTQSQYNATTPEQPVPALTARRQASFKPPDITFQKAGFTRLRSHQNVNFLSNQTVNFQSHQTVNFLSHQTITFLQSTTDSLGGWSELRGRGTPPDCHYSNPLVKLSTDLNPGSPCHETDALSKDLRGTWSLMYDVHLPVM